MKYIVLKPLEVDGKTLSNGDVVDASNWRNVKSLVDLRYLAPEVSGTVAPQAAIPKKPAPRKTTSAK